MHATGTTLTRAGQGAQHEVRHRDGRSAEPNPGRERKRRRLVQLGSSPPPLTTVLHRLAPLSRVQRANEPARPPAIPIPPRAAKKRNIILVQPKNPLELRSSSPVSPPHGDITTGVRKAAAPAAPQLPSISEAEHVNRLGSRELLRRNPWLDRIDPSSPIGTFDGQIVRSFDCSVRPSRPRSTEAASRHVNARTVGLPATGPPEQLLKNVRTRTRLHQVTKHVNLDDDENIDLLPDQARRKIEAPKRAERQGLARQKRRKPKIHRVQLGPAPPLSPADRPLSDADHHLNSQPDSLKDVGVEASNMADESEISYFPTLIPSRLVSSALQHGDEATEHESQRRPLDLDPNCQISVADRSSRSAPALNASRHDLILAYTDEHADEGDSGPGLLQVLSQSAVRKVDIPPVTRVRTPQVPLRGHILDGSSDPTRSQKTQHQVQVNFDPLCYTNLQAQQIAASVTKSKSQNKAWTPVHPDTITERWKAMPTRKANPVRLLQYGWCPPSSSSISRDLGLSPSQMLQRSGQDLPDFVHCNTVVFNETSRKDDDEELGPFEHGLRFVGYCLPYQSQSEATTIPQLQPLDAVKLQKRMQSCRKEVVKIIIPFSEPALSSHATQARFVTPQPELTVPPTPSFATCSDVLLVWMHSTARIFLDALEVLLQADLTCSIQSECLDLSEIDLYPGPILHCVAHAGDVERATARSQIPSYVALYVHLDRMEEARQKLGSLNLADCGTYRPFNDPLLRLLVTSIGGEPLCLI
ncbi:uncharacterized protein MEPE_03051 [Melanopsichium pennsylvanicum]|uniref:Uncharacterized protein n=2 Tax=Melanopsichium pennsylvanicum TaxID=63383 RepID=A0AAJ4XM27_9BASI|nr:hypothetical protein BN887_03927 [Melanopsichium pennsylvanicum 4]SNX84342.1 uncharacterized protein MEPE_03051 [Melanopsichium pennsylvanicum]